MWFFFQSCSKGIWVVFSALHQMDTGMALLSVMQQKKDVALLCHAVNDSFSHAEKGSGFLSYSTPGSSFCHAAKGCGSSFCYAV
jgi:hypothetical protein